MAFCLKTESMKKLDRDSFSRSNPASLSELRRARTSRPRFSRTLKNAYRRPRMQGLGLRHYSPGVGRWPSRDPIGEQGGVNLFAFTGNSALSRIDKDGMAWWEWVPIVSTSTHTWQRYRRSVPGMKVEDYESCKTLNPSEETVLVCETAIGQLAAKYISSFVGVSTGADCARTLLGGTAGLIGACGIKTGIRGSVGGTVTGGALAADAILDAGIVVDIVLEIKAAAEKARSKYCPFCP